MSDRPEEERRRTGPLGDEDDETRQVPTENGPEVTRRVRSGGEESASSESRRAAQGPSEDNETRVIRAPSHPDTTRDATPYPRGYFEAADEREDRLRDMYGVSTGWRAFSGSSSPSSSGRSSRSSPGSCSSPSASRLTFRAGRSGPPS